MFKQVMPNTSPGGSARRETYLHSNCNNLKEITVGLQFLWFVMSLLDLDATIYRQTVYRTTVY